MRRTNWVGVFALAAGICLPVALSAQERYGQYRDSFGDRQDVRRDYRDLHRDHEAAERLQAEIARDRLKLDENIRCGREWAARRNAADLARDQRALRALRRDMRWDRGDMKA
jgi:hypothetical protein